MPLQKANSWQRLKQNIRSKQFTTKLLQQIQPSVFFKSMQQLIAWPPATEKPLFFTTKYLSDKNRKALLFFMTMLFIFSNLFAIS